MSQPVPPQPAAQPAGPVPAWKPAAGSRNKKLWGSIILMVVAGILAGLVVAMAYGEGPVAFLVGVIPCTAMLAAAVLCYTWLDRWEPEPWAFLGLGFLWGGGIATGFALLVQLVEALLGLVPDQTVLAVVQAPVAEEIGKGSFLFLMALTMRRKELNTLVDHLVYAGFVGLGFAFVEDLLYFARSESLLQTGFMVVLRLWSGIFAHPLFTSMTAFGLYLGRRRSGVARVLVTLGGLVVAMLTHALWNGSASFGLLGFGGVYLLVMAPVFVLVVRLAIRSRKAEGETMARQMPGLVAQGVVNGYEASWLGNLAGRSTRRRQAAVLAGGKPAAHQLMRFADAVTELAFLRDRIDKGESSPAMLTEHQRLLQQVAEERTAALPALRAIVNAPLDVMDLTPPPAPPAGRPGVAAQPQVPTAAPGVPGTPGAPVGQGAAWAEGPRPTIPEVGFLGGPASAPAQPPAQPGLTSPDLRPQPGQAPAGPVVPATEANPLDGDDATHRRPTA